MTKTATVETTAVVIDGTKVAETTHVDAATEKATPTTCANGHDRATYWTTTAGGRKYCKECAREASRKSRAKNPRPSTRKVVNLSDDALDAILRVAFMKNTKAEIREELQALVATQRPSPVEN